MLQVHIIPCLTDNYAYLVENIATRQAWVIDPSEAPPVQAALARLGLKLTQILNTHHHWDHVGGNKVLNEQTGAPILCSRYDQSRIEGASRGLVGGDVLHFGESSMRVIGIPGHTLGHIAFYFDKEHFAFTGDTLFSAGCGRLFEGTPAQMFESLKKLCALPDRTLIYCGHEYTASNLNFAGVIEPSNNDIATYTGRVHGLRAKRESTMPSSIELEKKVNVFVRAQSVEELALLRSQKDNL